MAIGGWAPFCRRNSTGTHMHTHISVPSLVRRDVCACVRIPACICTSGICVRVHTGRASGGEDAVHATTACAIGPASLFKKWQVWTRGERGTQWVAVRSGAQWLKPSNTQ